MSKAVTSSTAATDPFAPERDERVEDFRLVDEETAVNVPALQHPVEAAADHGIAMARAGRSGAGSQAETEPGPTFQDQPRLGGQSPTHQEVDRNPGRASQLSSGLEAVARGLQLSHREQVAGREKVELLAAEVRALLARHDNLSTTVQAHSTQLGDLETIADEMPQQRTMLRLLLVGVGFVVPAVVLVLVLLLVLVAR